ncbi:MAG: Spy/CpxP family protein refolding chaperone, partial [Planctomycetota bacterium]
MRNVWLTGMMAFALVYVAVAQPEDAGPPQQPAAQQPGQGRPRGAPGPGTRGPGRQFSVEGMARRLARQLDLTPEQQQAMDALVTKYQAQPGRGDARELMREMRAAQQAGDEARAAELRAALRDRGEATRTQMEQFFTELEPLLTDEQKLRLTDLRARSRMQRDAGQRGFGARELVRRLPDELALTPDQRTAFDALMAEQRAQWEQMGADWRGMREVREQLRQAREAGDEQRVAELEAQLQRSRPQPPNFDEFFSKLEPILTDEQKARLTQLRTDPPQPGAARGRAPDVAQILRTAQQLELTDQQRQRLRTIAREVRSAERGAADAAGR